MRRRPLERGRARLKAVHFVTDSIAFGPVPSRRLGRSLGVNNIPPKHCSYACVYCQVGPTTPMEVERRAFYEPDAIGAAVERKVDEARTLGARIDYITFVPDGEPTLDVNLGAEIGRLRRLGIPIAVITNASLLWQPDVRRDLATADLVSLKVDAVQLEPWRRVNRPHGSLSLDTVLGGIRDFAGEFGGELLTETMLVSGINDTPASIQAVAAFLEEIAPRTAYLAVPTRPPAEAAARPPEEAVVLRAYEILSKKLPAVELLVTEEEGPFIRTGDAEHDLLAILAVHPMRQEAVERYLADVGQGRDLVEDLIRADRVRRVEHAGGVFYVRRFGRVRCL